MASLQKRETIYYIVFSKRVNGTLKQKKFTLDTTLKREAQKKKLKFEELYRDGAIHPFQGWSPSIHQKYIAQQNNPFNSILLKDLAESFIANRSQANETTKDNYRRHMNMLMDQLDPEIPVTEITEQHIRDFCFRDDLAKATQASYLRHLKVFFRWLHSKNITTSDVTTDVKPPKVPDKISQKILSRQELDYIFEAFDHYISTHEQKGFITSDYQRRLWFKPLILTSYYTGLRASEVVNLRWTDVDLRGQNPADPNDHGFIYVTNSGSQHYQIGPGTRHSYSKASQSPLTAVAPITG
ncbi:MAG: phage integrase N-terminal SAM-like domain-containing protein [Fodinibius sp.]|nr:phage integrase N-terminal SAM-like domain-containing protein [Fodinibius sp.]